jgi:hypothetical protein
MRALCTAVAGALILAASAIPAKVNAATVVSFVNDSGFNIFAGNLGNQFVEGVVSGTSALTYGSDWLEFTVNPSTIGVVTVDVLANFFTDAPSYPNETYQLLVGGVNGASVIGQTTVTNTPVQVSLTGGLYYFLELASGAPSSPGSSTGSIQVTGGTEEGNFAPLPGALALFAGGLGLLGFAGLRRSRKTGRRLVA